MALKNLSKVLVGAMALCLTNTAYAGIRPGLISPGQPIQNGAGRDGYAFETKQVEIRNDVQVQFITFSSKDEYRAEYRKRVPAGDIPQAFSVIDTANYKVCKIYTIDPEIQYRPELYGHELMHCFFGNWHPGLGRK